ncbi:MAG TPA: 4Fe-4S dicluster domain-containing protein [Candidatus Lokiarchaeia archaeon]|nr:4Fe-4S dicluster domain-containing protein [Candidatus Lokiarchaeia archaeon]
MSVGKGRKILYVDPDLCTGCEVCESVCSFAHDGAYNPMNTRITRVRIEPVTNIAIGCQTCSDAACIGACPQKAITKKEPENFLIINENKCDGCGFCIRACPFGAITLHTKTNKAISCDLCTTTEYKEPQCVECCPKEAIRVAHLVEVSEDKRIVAVKKLMENLGKTL